MLLRKSFRCMVAKQKNLIAVVNKAQYSKFNSSEYTDFGFRTVKKNEKASKVNEVFSSVAPNYDLMNDLMSVGIHRVWKDKLISTLNPNSRTKLLDMAGGTGDIASRFVHYVGKQYSSNVTVCDINPDMLAEGQKRAIEDDLNINWQQCSADDLPFDDESFNAYTISFGIRNCTDKDKVLKEAYRVLKPGGRFLCLEFSHIKNPVLKSLCYTPEAPSIYQQYSFNVLPVMGEVVAQDWNSYQYLAESIAQFPTQHQFADMIKKAGFCAVTYENLTFGVCAIHSGFKLS